MLHPYAHYLQRWAHRDPDGEAVVDVARDIRLTWRELADRVARLAAHLAADGVGPGGRVAVRQANTHAHFEAVCAIAWCGAAFVPTLHTLTDAEREHIHAEIEPAAHLDARDTFAPAGRELIDPVQAGSEDLSSVLYTSGSTGAPKGVMHTMRSTQAAMAGWSRLTWRPEASKVLVTSPISHAAGRFVEAALVNGWSTVILDTARASAVLPAIERFDVSHALVVPTVLQEMVDSPLLGEHDLSSLAFLLYAAAPTSPSLVARAQERLGPILHTVYGSTEAPAPNTHLDADEHTRAIAHDLPMLRSCGREFPFGVQLRLVDEELRTIPEGGVGQLAMAASWNCAGFWRQPEAWAKRYHEGWILTGDVGRFEDGYLHLMDRADDMIISGGSNVYPTEIENVLSAHPGIREVVVFGEPHERWGESVLAVVATHSPLAESEIIDYCRPRLSAYKVPKRVVILDELPKSGVGKLSRKLARELVLRDVAQISGARWTVTAAPLEHARQVYSSDRIAEFVEGGFWLNRLPIDYLRDNAEHRPDRDAVVDEHRRCTWHELHVRVDRLATGLADLGLEPGDFVGVQLPNTAEFVEVYLAVQRAGLRAVTIMAIYRDRDVAYMLAKTRARALVIPDQHRGWDHRDMAARLAPDLPALRHVIVVGEPADGMVSLDSLDRPARPDLLNARRPDPDECSKVGFTSGTTGRPKGVVHTHNTDLVPPRQLGQVLGLDENSTIWMPSPIAHATGLLFGVYGSLLSGAPLVLQDRWDAGRALELIEREHVAMTVGATPFMAAMLDHPDLPHRDVSSFRYFACGGAVIPPRLVERANGEMGTRLLRVFGHSEAPLHTLNRPDDPWDKLLNTDGRLLPGCEVRISGPERLGLAGPDEVGEYATRGPHVFLGYFDEPELTAECRDADGWYHSGDLCRIDDDGHVTFVDRVKDIINRGGVKISALEVENVVREHPDVAQCAAVAMPDARLGERICVFVVPRAGAAVTLEQVTAMFDAGGVTRQKWPESLITVPELPSTPTGKVQKKLLRQQLENGDR